MSWSPDGATILFGTNGSLFVVHPDGSGLAKIPLPTGGRVNAFDPAWSPDGTRIVFALASSQGPTNGRGIIATANPDGSDIASTGMEGHHPNWGRHPMLP